MSITFKLFSIFSGLLATSFLVLGGGPAALACSPGATAASGVSHGSAIYSGSVTVCVGMQTTTPALPPATSSIAPKPATGIIVKPVTKPVACPTAQQKKMMPRSADAAERWIKSLCTTAKSAAVSTPIPAVKTPPVTLAPVSTSYNSAAVSFSPNPLRATVRPSTKFTAGDSTSFSSNPSLHYGSQSILGRQAEVQFAPAWLGWQFSDGARQQGVDIKRSFDSAGKYQAWAIANYFVSYRVIGESTWVQLPGQISVLSNVIDLEAAIKLPEIAPSPKRGLLVGDNCSSSPVSWGCTP
jgi:hypothetical protein